MRLRSIKELLCISMANSRAKEGGLGGGGGEFIKGELQHQNKLSSSERPFKILQSETKIDCFREKRQKTENVVF